LQAALGPNRLKAGLQRVLPEPFGSVEFFRQSEAFPCVGQWQASAGSHARPESNQSKTNPVGISPRVRSSHWLASGILAEPLDWKKWPKSASRFAFVSRLGY